MLMSHVAPITVQSCSRLQGVSGALDCPRPDLISGIGLGRRHDMEKPISDVDSPSSDRTPANPRPPKICRALSAKHLS